MKLFIPVLVCALGCSAFSSRPAEARLKNAIRIQMGGEPSSLEPWKSLDVYGSSILRNVVEGLYKLDENGELMNGLAASGEVSSDKLKYKFSLRPNAKWSDGKLVTVEDIIFGLRHGLDPKTNGPNAEYFFAIKNAREVFRGQMPLDKLGVSRDGDKVLIELSQPDPLLYLELALPAGSPLREDIYKAHGNRWSTDFPSTGDYKITAYKPADEIDLEPNPFAVTPGKQNIIFKILTEEITAMNLFESSRLDIIMTVTASEIESLKKQQLIQVVPSTSTYFLSFNTSKPPFDDIEWRRAVAGSIDREGLVKSLYGGFLPATSYLPPMIAGSLPYKPLVETAAIAKIKALKNKPRLHYAFGASAFTKTVAEKLQNDLSKNLGVQLELEPVELKTLIGRLRNDPPSMYFIGMSASFNDPITQLNSFSTASEPNFSRYVSASYQAQLEELRAEPFGPKRTQIATDLNRTLIDKDVVVVPIVLREQVYGVQKNIKGFHLSPYQTIHLGQLTK